MKKYLYLLLLTANLLCSNLIVQASTPNCSQTCSPCPTDNSCDATCNFPKTIFLPRSQGTNAARELVGWQQYINRFDVEAFYGSFAIALEYSQSFRPEIITANFFGPAYQNGLVTFSGSRVANRGTYDILADYFGLPVDFKSTVCFQPKIQNVITDFELYLGLDNWAPNTYLRIHAPLVYTKWGMNAQESIISTGTQPFDLGYMTELAIPRSSLPANVLDFFAGNSTWGDMKTPLAYGKISPCALTKVLLADLELILGWNVINADHYHFGINLRGGFPTGNKPDARFLFEPIVGNGGYFEFGVGLSSHAVLWEGDCSDSSLAAYLDANFTNLFCTKQKRAFDFCAAGNGSRYMLALEFQPLPLNPTTEAVLPLHLSNVGLTQEYDGTLFPAINTTALCTDAGFGCFSSLGLQADIAFKLSYNYCNITFDIGYNFWGRTKERLSINDGITTHKYALKGDSFLYGVASTSLTPAAVAAARAGYPTNAVPLSVSQTDSATLYSGANFAKTQTVQGQLNPGVDSPEKSQTTILNGLLPPSLVTVPVVSPIANDQITGTPIANLPINKSNPAHYFDVGSLEVGSAELPSQISNKIFAHFNYSFKNGITETGCMIPFIGIGGEVEFGSKPSNLGCTKCACQTALSQWGVWLKGGVAF